MKHLAERARIMGVLYPANRAAGEYITDWLSMQTVFEVLVVIKTGVMTATATFAAQLQQATDALGTGVKPIANKAITQLEHAVDGNDVVLIRLQADELDAANNYDWIRLRVTISNAAVYSDAVVMGTTLRYSPDAQALITEDVT